MIRETREETAYQFEPAYLVGIYRWQHPVNKDTYMRFCFNGNVTNHDPNQALDDDIHQAVWLTQEQIMRRQADFRSPLVRDCLNDYLSGYRFPLTLLHN
ncbi:MAG: NUDIX hydrolase [Gammaproteobacteria bacterium]|nr:NUDIX hydrolase [Gammaproteobacteria bacterium]